MTLRVVTGDPHDIDWDLLMLLARTEAAMRWPDAETGSAAAPNDDLSLPEGLDLRHSCDLDWVTRVAAEHAALPLTSIRLP